MSFSLTEVRFVDSVEVTDFVANGSFASLKENVSYKAQPDFAVLARLVDHNAGWKGGRVYVDEKAYKFLSKSSLTTGDVVIANVGANAGTVFQIPDLGTPITLGPNAVRVRPKGKDLDKEFLYYYLSSPLGQDKLQSIITGSAQPKFNKTALRGLSIRLPSFSYQRQTVVLVKALDDRITLLRETNATLEAIAQALFKSWFVDFDPVHAKMQGRAPEGMDEDTARLFPDELEESELGLVPRGWRVGTVDDLCDVITNGGTPSRSKSEFWANGSMPWFKTGDFSDGFLLTPAERITEAALVGSSVKVLPVDAILMAIYAAPTVGRLGVLTESATFNQACTGMVAKKSVGPWFLFLTLYFGRVWFNSRANGAAQQNISKAIVSSYKVVIPSVAVLAG
ncbi:restriction endonuclease subunit S, partial [Burkholderiaceae bacterium]|nr:restriction endonuclease subunit S [Burkholderiaceae bacterium]